MAQTTIGEQAAEVILERLGSMATAVTNALYAEMPELLERYGPTGRQRCLEDMHHNFEHLAAAVGLDSPGVFATYVRWVDSLLLARNVPTRELVRCLELMDEQLRGALAAEEAEVAGRCIGAGLEALERG